MKPEYCRAARALLGWSQEELAAAAKVSLTALKGLEKGLKGTRSSTLQALRLTLEAGGVEFIAGGGVRLAEERLLSHHLSGDDCIQRHNELIYATLRESDGEILTCSPDDTLWTSPLARRANAAFKEWRQKMNIRGKTLTSAKSRIFNEPRHQYRFLSPEAIGTITYVIYANRISFILWQQKKVFVLQNPLIVDTFRRQFDFLWHAGRKSPL